MHIYQSIHCTGLLVMLKARPLLTGDVDEAREVVAFSVVAAAVAEKHLDHARMVFRVVARPWYPVLHHPSFFRHLYGLRHQRVDPHFELLIFSL